MEPQSAAHLSDDQCMSDNVIAVSAYESMGEVYSILKSKRIRRLPVIDHDRLIGIVT